MSGSRWGARDAGPRRPERWVDPMPPRGLCERVYTELRARTGAWSPDFLRIVQVAYRGIIPPRFLAIVARLERERPWEIPVAEPTGLPPTIHYVHPDGRVESWRPTREEWEAAT